LVGIITIFRDIVIFSTDDQLISPRMVLLLGLLCTVKLCN